MIPIIIVLALFVALMWMYNILIANKNEVLKSFGQIDILLKKRFDLIPNLVETVKVYMRYEKGLLTDITELRAKAMAAGTYENNRIAYENQLTQKLGNIMVAAENYPDLKASQSFIQLQSTWKDLEDQIAAARLLYNTSVTIYNNAVEMFPTNLMAVMIDYKPKSLFEAAVAEKENIKAKELFQ